MSPPGDSTISRLAGIFHPPAHASPVVTLILGVVAAATAIFHMIQLDARIVAGGQFTSLHLNLAILICLLGLLESIPPERKRDRRLLSGLSLLALVPLFYIHFAYPSLVNERTFLPNTPDMIVAVLMMALAIFVSIREWGWIIPAIAVLGLLYGYFGNIFPGYLFYHNGISLERLIGYTSIPYFRGLLGSLTSVSANTIFIFMIFAGLLKGTGGLDLLMKVAFTLAGRSRAGPAQASVIGSGFMGMLSGSTMANVASTGAFTIPLMKRFGFKSTFAGAVEAVASAGGQITPPKMGLAAFLIVGITGIPYVEVMAAAVFPAIIYFAYLMAAVHIQAVRSNINAAGNAVDDMSADLPLADISLGRAFLLYAHPVVGLVLLIWLLMAGLPASSAALYAVLAVIALELIKRLVLNLSNPVAGLGTFAANILNGLASGARSGAQVAVVVAVISIMVEMLVATGFAQKLSYMMLEIAGGNLVPLMLIAGLSCLVFGVGMPTSAAYILVALLGAPALVELGVPLLAAHLFVFYLANMSAITPPVAVGCLIAANIAQAPFFRTAFIAMRLAVPGFVLPFMFVLRPEILGIDATLVTQILTTVLVLLGLVAINMAVEGYMLTRLSIPERILLVPVTVGLLAPSNWTTIAAVAIFAGVLVLQVLRTRNERAGPGLGRPSEQLH
ncbi:TRAP transporter fused permease subunit [Fodinicurvata sp. EGI_FJ10296]|uniref:TRAP transporter permease n=1 Tax=Fodinicurvata sp. EGI_FJ10296 TaxID=3231908 RepID=UPI003456D5DA